VRPTQNRITVSAGFDGGGGRVLIVRLGFVAREGARTRDYWGRRCGRGGTR
jgi:hypothetical protein